MTDRLDPITGRIGVGVLLVLFLTVGVWGQQSFRYSEASSNVILRYSRTPAELGGSDTSTTVTVYGDGTVVVHYPQFGKRRGDYTKTLIRAELDDLIASIVNKGVVDSIPGPLRKKSRRLWPSNLGAIMSPTPISPRSRSISPATVPQGCEDRKRSMSTIELPALPCSSKLRSYLRSSRS